VDARRAFATGLLLWPGAVLAGTVPQDTVRAQWKSILEDEVKVRCGKWEASKWCEARTVLPGSTDAIRSMMEEVEGLPELFPRMVSMKRVAPGIYHQIIDYPFPYDDRDLVVAFSWTRSETSHILQWHSVDQPSVTSVGVRLTRAQGQFQLQPRPDGLTDLTYVWRGDLGPGVPEWVWPFAWKSQAREVVEGMTEGLRQARERP